jgi:membrane associated rhomboid family serine protease
MLFPIGDDNSNRRIVPMVNYTLIGDQPAGLLQPADRSGLHLWLQRRPGRDHRWPRHRRHGQGLATTSCELLPGPTPIYLTLVTAMFMHGDWGHLLGNMLYLWIFGDNIEDRLGHGRYLLFYLVCGLLASLTHIYFGPRSLIPSLGASGAIAGVLGAYLDPLSTPGGPCLPVWADRRDCRRSIVIGFWGLLQFLNGFGSLGSVGESGGVAYMAHIGGFVAGIVIDLCASGEPNPLLTRIIS